MACGPRILFRRRRFAGASCGIICEQVGLADTPQAFAAAEVCSSDVCLHRAFVRCAARFSLPCTPLCACFWASSRLASVSTHTLATTRFLAHGQRSRPTGGQEGAGIVYRARDVRFLSAALEGRAPSRRANADRSRSSGRFRSEQDDDGGPTRDKHAARAARRREAICREKSSGAPREPRW